ncbi:hypothetical protein [Pseudomonas aeruginosa]|uniref:hypothetical protein n=1 Tax=Pseudomonas aeruginosa TaxID=287 RepID=UPI003B52293A
MKHIDQKTVSETIDVMVKADPSLAWLREAEKQGDVDWRKVQEVHDSFKYSHSGVGRWRGIGHRHCGYLPDLGCG